MCRITATSLRETLRGSEVTEMFTDTQRKTFITAAEHILLLASEPRGEVVLM